MWMLNTRGAEVKVSERGGYFTPNILFFVLISVKTSIDIELYKFPPFHILYSIFMMVNLLDLFATRPPDSWVC